MAKETSIEVKVGALIVFCVLLLVGFQLLLGDFHMGESAKVVVDFETSAALKEGAPVKVAGLPAGRVEKIEYRGGELDPDVGRPVFVRVTLSVKPDLVPTLRDDAQFYITTQGLLGEKYVEIDPGHGKGPLGDKPKVGVPPMRIEVMAANLNTFLDRGSKLLRDNEQAVTDTIADVRQAAKSGRQALEEARTLISDARKKIDAITERGLTVMTTANEVMTELTPGKGETGNYVKQVLQRGSHLVATVDDTVGDGSALKQTVADVRDAVATAKTTIAAVGGKAVSLVTKAEGVVDDAGHLVRDGRTEILKVAQKVQGILDSVQTTLVSIRDGHGTIGTLLNDREMYDDMREMMKDLKRHPWKFLWKE